MIEFPVRIKTARPLVVNIFCDFLNSSKLRITKKETKDYI